MDDFTAAVQFVRGAVASTDFIPVLTHIAIKDGRLHGFDGRVHLSAPAQALGGLSCTVDAYRFLAALAACAGQGPELVQQGAGSPLICRAGSFCAELPTGPIEQFPLDDPPQGSLPWPNPPLQLIAPFVGEDATHPWACAALLEDRRLSATNNVILASCALQQSWTGPPVLLPQHCITEILRIDEVPVSVHVSAHAITLWYEGGRWLKSNLLEGAWPQSPLDTLRKLHEGARFTRIGEELADAVERVRPFVADRRAPIVILQGDSIRTQDSEQKARVDGAGAFGDEPCAFRVEPLLKVLEVANEADWTKFPRVPWRGDCCEGVLVGVRI